MQRFTDLKVWRQSHTLALDIYKVTERFPPSERFGITAQLRRAAVSVPTNLAEGAKRKHRSEYARFINLAEGSVAETEYLLFLARDLGFLPPSQADGLLSTAQTIGRMLHGLRVSVERSSDPV
jgi:four helix bundle protein